MRDIGDKIKQAGKKLLKKIRKVIRAVLRQVLIKILPIILIALGIIVLIGAITYFITIDDGSHNEGDNGNVPNVTEKVLTKNLDDNGNLKVTKKNDNGGYKLDIDLDKAADEIIDTLNKNEGRLNIYLKEDKRKERLKTFIKAEIVTQYPDLRSADKIGQPTDDNEVQGVIKIKRKNNKDEESILTYIDYATFDSYVKTNDEKVLSHFSLNENGQLILASSTKKDVEVDTNVPNYSVSNSSEFTIQTTTMDYKQMLSKYTMPFDFLWALLVSTDGNEEFVDRVAQLALKSDIVITPYDNVTTIVEEDKTEYKKKTQSDIYVRIKDSSGNPIGTTKKTYTNEEKNSEYYATVKTTTVTDSVSLQVTKADTWIAKYINEYQFKDIGSTTNETDTAPTNATYITVVDRYLSPEEIKKDPDAQLVQNQIIAAGNISEIISVKRNEQIKENGTHCSNTVSGNEYIAGTSSIEEKTDKNATEDNFVSLLVMDEDAKDTLLSGADWFFAMLESGEKTANMIDVVKYLLYKASGKDFGVKEFDFSVFDISKFSSMSGGGVLDINSTTLTKDEFIQKVQNYSAAVANARTLTFRDNAGVIYDTCKAQNINPVLCAAQGWQEQAWVMPRSSPYNFWGIAVYNGQDYGNAYPNMKTAVEGYCKTIKAYEEGGNLYSTVKERAQEYSKYNPKIIGDMSTIYDIFCMYAYVGSGHTKQEEADYAVDYVDKVIQCAKQIFGDGVLTGGVGGGDIAKAGLQVHNEEKNWTYSLTALTSGDIDKALTNPSKCTCCCTYVSCVLYRAGLVSHDEISSINYNYCGSLYPLLEKKGWQKITARGKLEPGDVVFYGPNNHTQIYAGNNTWFNAGSTGAIQGACPQQQGADKTTGFTIAFRPPATQKSSE